MHACCHNEIHGSQHHACTLKRSFQPLLFSAIALSLYFWQAAPFLDGNLLKLEASDA